MTDTVVAATITAPIVGSVKLKAVTNVIVTIVTVIDAAVTFVALTIKTAIFVASTITIAL